MVAPNRRSLELIPNEINRKMAFRKRKKSIYKKADELSKLCDIDVCLIVYQADQKKGMPIQPETWPQDPIEFNRILNKYKASRDVIIAPGPKRKFGFSDFYEVQEKDVNDKLTNLISEDRYPTWDDRIEDFSQDELTQLLRSLEEKIQASTNKIDSLERTKRFVAKRNQNVSKSIAPQRMMVRLVDQEQQPYQVPPPHQTSHELGAFSMISTSINNAMLSMPTYVRKPMLPSAWISSSESSKIQ